MIIATCNHLTSGDGCMDSPLGMLKSVQDYDMMESINVTGFLNIRLILEPLKNIEAHKANFYNLKKSLSKPFQAKYLLNDKYELLATKGKNSDYFEKCWTLGAEPFIIVNIDEKRRLVEFMGKHNIPEAFFALHSQANVMMTFKNNYFGKVVLDVNQLNAQWPKIKLDGLVKLSTSPEEEGHIICQKPVQDFLLYEDDYLTARNVINNSKFEQVLNIIIKLKFLFAQQPTLDIEEPNKVFTFVSPSVELLESFITKNSINFKNIVMFNDLCIQVLQLLEVSKDGAVFIRPTQPFLDYLGTGLASEDKLKVFPMGKLSNDILKVQCTLESLAQRLSVFKFTPALDYKEATLHKSGFLIKSNESFLFKPLFVIDYPMFTQCKDIGDQVPKCNDLSMKLEPFSQACGRELASNAHSSAHCPLQEQYKAFTVLRSSCDKHQVDISSTKGMTLDLVCNGQRSQTFKVPKGSFKIKTLCAIFEDKFPVLAQAVKKASFEKIPDLGEISATFKVDYKALLYSGLTIGSIIITIVSVCLSMLCYKKCRSPPISKQVSMMSIKSNNEESIPMTSNLPALM